MDPAAVSGARIHRRLDFHRLTDMEETQAFAVCFSGHRPEKLPSGDALTGLKRRLKDEIIAAINDGADTFYSGMAEGVDIWAAQLVLLMRERQKLPVRLIAVLPYADHGKGLRRTALYRYQTILQNADEVITMRGKYLPSCYKERNQYMIEHSRRLIAVVGEMKSGTGQTIRMAEKRGLDVRRIQIPPALL